MKKNLFVLGVVLYSLVSNSQSHDFEDLTWPGLPEGWMVADNDVGNLHSWEVISEPDFYVMDTKAMFIDREAIGVGNTSMDYLITNLVSIPANGQLRFFIRQTLPGDQGSTFDVRYSNSSQSFLGAYEVLQTWTEAELLFCNEENVCGLPIFGELVINLMPFFNPGDEVYFAFVRTHHQFVPGIGGDRICLDNFHIGTDTLEINNKSSMKITVYPNPVSNVVYLNIPDMNSTAAIYDLAGRKALATNEKSIDVSQLPSGMYVLEVMLENGGTSRHKLIKS